MAGNDKGCKGFAKKAVHKHEKEMHPGKKLTKISLQKGKKVARSSS